MRKLLISTSDERGATMVEYGVLIAVFVLGLIPAVNLTTDAVADANDKTVSHFATTAYSYNNGGGGGGGGGGTTTTSTTTTTAPPTTTTTTAPPTTTTTTMAPAQTKTASFDDDVSVTFHETDGEVTFDSVASDGWTYEVTKDTGTRIHVTFRRYEPDHKVVLKGYLNSEGILKTRVVERY